MRKILALAALTLMLMVSTGAAPPRSNPHPVAMPVVLDGVRHQPGAFNALKPDLDARFTLHYAILAAEQDTLYAFRSLDALKRFVTAQPARRPTAGGKLAKPISAPAASHGCNNHANILTSRFFGDANCGGWQFNVNPTVAVPSLVPYGINDQMSSLACAVDSTWTTWCVIWEHIDYGGASLWFQYGVYTNNLGDAGFNDRASSIIVYGQPT